MKSPFESLPRGAPLIFRNAGVEPEKRDFPRARLKSPFESPPEETGLSRTPDFPKTTGVEPEKRDFPRDRFRSRFESPLPQRLASRGTTEYAGVEPENVIFREID